MRENGFAPLESSTQSDECLIADSREFLTPSEIVERKLVTLLKQTPLPVSHLAASAGLRMRGLQR